MIEDKKEESLYLTEIIKNVNGDVEILSAFSFDEACVCLMKYHIDIFVVDIILNSGVVSDVSGIRLVQKVREMKEHQFTPIIFVTALQDPEIYAYKKLYCLDYIEKPFDPQRVVEVLKRAFEFPVKKENRELLFRNDGILWAISVNDIVYIEVIKRHIYVHTKTQTQIFPYQTVKSLLEMAGTYQLQQCRRDIIVNLEQVKCYNFRRNCLVMKNGNEIDVGVTYRKKMQELLSV